MSEVFAKPVRFEAVPAAQWPAYMTDNWGVPPELAASTIGPMQTVEAGHFDVVTGDYARITGHAPLDMRQFLQSLRT